MNRHATLIKGCSVALLVGSLLLASYRLPVGSMAAATERWVEGLGPWGPVVFGLLYVAAVLLLVPAAAWTVAAGALFGPVTGTAVSSLASTTGAGLAFLTARYLARDWVIRQARRHPRFEAIDRAVQGGGWKVVALLRLSPAVPYTLQNYVYGLTGLRFWPYLLTSWLAMLPGTFLYVYLGHVGRAGLEGAGGEHSRGPAEWAMLVVNLLATVAATGYLTHLARKALRGLPAEVSEYRPEPTPENSWPWGTVLLALAALAALAAALFLQFRPDVFKPLLGP